MDTYNTKPKKTVELLNVWYSETAKLWFTCVLIPKSLDLYFTTDIVYKREKVAHADFHAALEYVNRNYTGGTK